MAYVAPYLDDHGFTPSQALALSVVPRITGIASMFGSGWIILEVAGDRNKQGKVYHRLVLCMSCYNFCASTFYFVSTWCIPQGLSTARDMMGAKGTEGTCNLQGFFLQLALATPLYNMYLSLYYLLLIRYNWTEGRIRREAEPWMHGVANLLCWGTAIACLPLNLYNPSIAWCWIAPSPLNCHQSYENDGESDCARGDNASIYMYAFFLAELWFAIFLAIASLALVYWTVLKQERSVDRYSYATRERRRKRSRAVANHSMMYIAAFLFTWIFPTVNVVVFSRPGASGNIFILNLMTTLILPLQGFFNFLIYVRPRFHKYRKENPDARVFGLFRKVMRRAVQFRKKESDDEDHHLGTGTGVEELRE